MERNEKNFPSRIVRENLYCLKIKNSEVQRTWRDPEIDLILTYSGSYRQQNHLFDLFTCINTRICKN